MNGGSERDILLGVEKHWPLGVPRAELLRRGVGSRLANFGVSQVLNSFKQHVWRKWSV